MTEWTQMRVDWGFGTWKPILDSDWDLLLVLTDEVRHAGISKALLSRVRDVEDYLWPYQLLASRIRSADEETLFEPAGRYFVHIAGFRSEEYARDFGDSIARQTIAPDWDGDWHDLDDVLGGIDVQFESPEPTRCR